MVEATNPAVGLKVTCRDTGDEHELTAYHAGRAARLFERGRVEMQARAATQGGGASTSVMRANPRDVHMLVEDHESFSAAFPTIRLVCSPRFTEGKS